MVQTRTLDSFDLAECQFIKIDVEGHELEVLNGAKETLARCRPTVLVESSVNSDPAGKPNEVIKFFERLDYSGFLSVHPNRVRLSSFEPDLHQKMVNGSRQDPYGNMFFFEPIRGVEGVSDA